jgi:2,4-dienoyl-CoA reductase-like NADH-dependent reductase (Old Yellow Enzyme family)
MPDVALFTPARLRGLELANRIVVSPMCQYSAHDGSASDWHMMHLGMLANSGAGLLVIEATAVEREGRITHGCLGLYSEENERALERVITACRRYGTARLGIQLGHAGRKASAKRPWESKTASDPLTENAWPTKAPSPIPFGPGWHTPEAYTEGGLDDLIAKFVMATRRAERLGLDVIEVHAAHGYLLHEFLSPLSNKRTDRWGGSLENRMRLPLAVFRAMREAWPHSKPMGVRISATDWVDGGWTIEDSVVFASRLKALGCDFIDVSSGGNDPSAKVPVGPGYQVPFAERIRKAVDLPVMAVGMITEPEQAESIVAEGRADFVALARAFLDDPHWGWHAAYRLGREPVYPVQYRRAALKVWEPASRYAARR